MISKSGWKKIWLIFGILFIFISIFMIFGAPTLTAVTGTKPFSVRARAMINFFWIWMLIYNGIGNLFVYQNMEKNENLLKLGIPAGLAFSILQSLYMGLGYFEYVFSEVMWAVLPLIWVIIIFIYFLTK